MMLCGDLSGQHLIVPIDQFADFTFQFYMQGSVGALTNQWKIQVTQLECPQTDSANKPGLFTIPRRTSLNDLRKMFAPKSNDAEMIAPPGCDQYYTEQSRTIKSFNYKVGGQYPFNLHYTICIKRRIGDTTLK